jgi:hypothetical protein
VAPDRGSRDANTMLRKDYNRTPQGYDRDIDVTSFLLGKTSTYRLGLRTVRQICVNSRSVWTQDCLMRTKLLWMTTGAFLFSATLEVRSPYTDNTRVVD